METTTNANTISTEMQPQLSAGTTFLGELLRKSQSTSIESTKKSHKKFDPNFDPTEGHIRTVFSRPESTGKPFDDMIYVVRHVQSGNTVMLFDIHHDALGNPKSLIFHAVKAFKEEFPELDAKKSDHFSWYVKSDMEIRGERKVLLSQNINRHGKPQKSLCDTALPSK